jgi:anti-sigma factor RsiW
MNFHGKDRELFLNLYVDGGLLPEEREELERHLSECRTCREDLEVIRRSDKQLKEILSCDNPPEFDLDELWMKINQSTSRHHCSFWERVAEFLSNPAVWIPGAMTAAAAILLALFLFQGSEKHTSIQVTQVESVYSETGQVMVLQTPSQETPLIWILPGEKKETG